MKVVKSMLSIESPHILPNRTVQEYILPYLDDSAAFLVNDSRVRAVENRTGCRIFLRKQVVNRRVNDVSWIKYAIVHIEAPSQESLHQCNILLERVNPTYMQRRPYKQSVKSLRLLTQDDTPDNISLILPMQRTNDCSPYYGHLRLETPYTTCRRRPLSATPWKVDARSKLGGVDSETTAVRELMNYRQREEVPKSSYLKPMDHRMDALSCAKIIEDILIQNYNQSAMRRSTEQSSDGTQVKESVEKGDSKVSGDEIVGKPPSPEVSKGGATGDNDGQPPWETLSKMRDCGTDATSDKADPHMDSASATGDTTYQMYPWMPTATHYNQRESHSHGEAHFAGTTEVLLPTAYPIHRLAREAFESRPPSSGTEGVGDTAESVLKYEGDQTSAELLGSKYQVFSPVSGKQGGDGGDSLKRFSNDTMTPQFSQTFRTSSNRKLLEDISPHYPSEDWLCHESTKKGRRPSNRRDFFKRHRKAEERSQSTSTFTQNYLQLDKINSNQAFGKVFVTDTFSMVSFNSNVSNKFSAENQTFDGYQVSTEAGDAHSSPPKPLSSPEVQLSVKGDRVIMRGEKEAVILPTENGTGDVNVCISTSFYDIQIRSKKSNCHERDSFER